MVLELPAGKGFADCAFIPYKPDIPALIIELKKNLENLLSYMLHSRVGHITEYPLNSISVVTLDKDQ